MAQLSAIVKVVHFYCNAKNKKKEKILPSRQRNNLMTSKVRVKGGGTPRNVDILQQPMERNKVEQIFPSNAWRGPH